MIVWREHLDFIIQGPKVFVRCQSRKADPPTWCDGTIEFDCPSEGKSSESKCPYCGCPAAVAHSLKTGVSVYTPIS